MKQYELFLPPEEAANEQQIFLHLKKKFADVDTTSRIQITKRSIDARSRNVKIRLLVNVFNLCEILLRTYQNEQLLDSLNLEKSKSEKI